LSFFLTAKHQQHTNNTTTTTTTTTLNTDNDVGDGNIKMKAAHYDHGRNFIAMVKGHKRYVISPPRVCQDLELLSHGNPSAR
jgi:hypothetical protein